MQIEWLNPVMSAYKHRQEISDLLTRGLAYVLGKKTMIAVTGMQGAGKTVLMDFLTGKARKPGYQMPLRSQSLEKGMLPTKPRRPGSRGSPN